MGISIPSEAEYASKSTPDFALFPPDDYVLEVESITIQKDKVDIYDKPKPGTPQRTYDGLEVHFRPISFANGDELQDEDGNDIPANRNPLFFDWFDPERVGLKPRPAKARKFFAYSTGVELEDRIDIENFGELVGKRLIGTVIVNAKGEKRRNRITDYRPIRTRRRKAADPEQVTNTTAPANVEVTAVTQAEKNEVFAVGDDDLPF